MSFFIELKRRNVFRVGIAYVVSSWLLLQLTEVLMEILDLPSQVGRTVLLLLVIGLVPALVLAWAFELTPDGVKREKDVDHSSPELKNHGRVLDRMIIAMLVIALVYFVWESRFSSDVNENTNEVSDTPAVIKAEKADPDAIEKALKTGDPVEVSLAVLPFINMSAEPDNEYFSDGISEELLNILAKIDGLRVPSRTSSFTYKGSSKNALEIGTELNVHYLLEGSVRKDGNRIRVTAQLIDVETDTHLWSETYTRELNDLFAVQDELARAIVNALKVTMGGVPMEELLSKGTDNVRAYNLFLEGRHLWYQRTSDSLLESIEILRKAVEIDPQFYRAWSALADSYLLIPEYLPVVAEEYIQPAREASAKALAINPSSARALNTQAYIRFFYDFDWAGAEADFKKAIEISPDYATAHQWYSEMLAAQRRFDEAIEQAQIAVNLDPHSAVMRMVLGVNSMFAGKLDDALIHLKAAFIMAPDMTSPAENLSLLTMYRGEYDDAMFYSGHFARQHGWSESPEKPVIEALVNPNLKPAALEYIRTTPFPFDQVYYRPVYAMLLGDKELALNLLEQAFENDDPYRSAINKIYAFRNLRGEPRFIALLARINLEP